jgi:cell wall-associated NlpC family hydrolase
MAINGVAVAAIGTGIVFAWSGVKGWAVLGTIGDIVSGKQPNKGFQYPLTNPKDPTLNSSGSAIGVGAAVGGIGGDAQRYIGHIYLFGGAPGKDGRNPWDCSSFVNWVVGHDMGMAIPGMGRGKYDGTSHGPPTGSWGIWPGLRRISRADVQEGDIIVWSGHMGIALGNNSMVSATGPNGTPSTVVSPIDGHGNGPILKYGRLV